MEIPIGKGLWIWKIWTLEGSTIDDVQYDRIVDSALKAGYTHLYIKIADGTYPYNVRWENYPWWSGRILEDFALRLASKARDAGLKVYGWHYVRGTRPLDEAKVAIDRTKDLRLDGYSIDAEHEYKQPGKATAAAIYAQELNKGIPNYTKSLASYRFPFIHMELPWKQFLSACQYIAPQMYWQGAHNPVQQLAQCIKEYDQLQSQLNVGPLPLAPIGSAYSEHGWAATPEDVTSFLQASYQASMIESASLWSMDEMRSQHPELWKAASNFEWGEPAPPPQVPIEEWSQAMDDWARTQGYTGPEPEEG